jgi:hypothetical protein
LNAPAEAARNGSPTIHDNDCDDHGGGDDHGSGCRVGVLFSGGLDCAVVAALADRHVPHGAPIELVNVSFHGGDCHDVRPPVDEAVSAPAEDYAVTSALAEGQEGAHATAASGRALVAAAMPGRAAKRQRGNAAAAAAQPALSFGSPSPDRLAAIAAVAELRRLCPAREWRLVGVDVNYATDCAATDAQRAWLLSLCGPRPTHMDLNIATALHFAAMGHGRIILSPPSPQRPPPPPWLPLESTIGEVGDVIEGRLSVGEDNVGVGDDNAGTNAEGMARDARTGRGGNLRRGIAPRNGQGCWGRGVPR